MKRVPPPVLLAFLLLGIPSVTFGQQPTAFIRTDLKDPRAPLIGQSALLITTTGIGIAEIGMPLTVLRNKTPELQAVEISSYLGDWDATAFKMGEETLFCLLHLPDSIPEQIGDILTTNPHFYTENGLRPGMRLEEAVQIAGKATLFTDDSMDSQEFVVFENMPFSNIKMCVKSKKGTQAGIYPAHSSLEKQPTAEVSVSAESETEDTTGKIITTQEYDKDAVIESITVTAVHESND